jgi:hypothetical protein
MSKRQKMLTWVWRRVGRRGATLILLGLIDLTFAYSYLNPGPPQYRSPATLFLQTVAPLWFWALLWAGVGVIVLQQAFQDNDKVGYSSAVVLKVLWALLHTGGTLFADLHRGYVVAMLWLVLSGWVYIISTWPEPTWPEPPPPPVVPRPDSDPLPSGGQ